MTTKKTIKDQSGTINIREIEDSDDTEIIYEDNASEEIFINIQNILKNTGIFTDNQIINLTSLQFKRNSEKFNFINLNNKAFLYDVIGYCYDNQEKIDEIIENFKDVINKNQNQNLSDYDFLFKSQAFFNEEKIYFAEIEQSKEKMEVKKGILACPRCKSMKTLTVTKQTRSADENFTLFNTCSICGNKWKVQN